ncbi:hypothetical protein F972_01538 [Acinetobacter sp. CIP 102529]|nr:hypothetical protein F972_01538 [Acinetobacter sp. CIP 102529]
MMIITNMNLNLNRFGLFDEFLSSTSSDDFNKVIAFLLSELYLIL